MVTRLLALLGAVVIALGSAACGGRKGSEDENVAPEVRMEQVEFQVFRGPDLTASGSAASARLRRDTHDLQVESIQIKFPPAPGREEAVVSARQGHGNVEQRWFEADGGVHAVQGDDSADTERARYSKEDGLVRGASPVTVSGPGYRLTGPGFTLDPLARSVRIDGGATIRAGEASR